MLAFRVSKRREFLLLVHAVLRSSGGQLAITSLAKVSKLVTGTSRFLPLIKRYHEFERMSELDAAIGHGARRRRVDPHEEGVEIFRLQEAVVTRSASALLLRLDGGKQRLLERCLLSVRHTGL